MGNFCLFFSYNHGGNIDSKTDVGTYGYNNANKKHSLTDVTTNNGSVPIFTQNITFSSYERPTKIEENGFVLDYTYDAGYQRSKGVMTQGVTNVYTRYYFGDYEKTISGGVTRELHYISSPAGLIAIVERVNDTDNYHYTYTDHLGSILTVTNSGGTIEAEQSFDAWGRRRNAGSWILQAATTSTGLPWLYRGFTGHEHLDQFGLINMNARLYDPVLARMISPDNFVNGAFNSQGYNRYSYANNNPLSYVDPDGNFAFIALAAYALEGALISAAVNVGIQVVQNGGFNNFDWNSLGMAGLQGAIGAGFAYGIGELGISSNLLSTGVHAVSGGIQSAIFGGNFLQGAISGGIGSAVGSFVNERTKHLDAGLVGSFVIAGSISAITANVTGGDPFQAFVIGGTVAAFNHYLHTVGPIKPYNADKDPIISGGLAFATALTLDDMSGIGVIDDPLIPLTLGGIGIYYSAKTDLVGKMSREIGRIARKTAGPNGVMYELSVNKSGFYIDVRGNSIFLNKGDVWKFGQTTGTRYSRGELANMVPGGVTQTTLYRGNQMQILTFEKFMIYGHFMTYGSLPPGNRIFR